MLTTIFAVVAGLSLIAAIHYRGRLRAAETSTTTLKDKVDAAERGRDQASAAAAQHEAVLETERRGHQAQLEQLQAETEKKVKLVSATKEEQAEQANALPSATQVQLPSWRASVTTAVST